jgi:2-hydroxycyclohexanecarboxyl-CoA dehydrogenase
VTGAGGGIGGAIAERLAAEGSQVIVCDVHAAAADTVVAQIRSSGGGATVLAFDLTDPDSCATAVEQVLAEQGRLDVLVNNAGINRRGDLLSFSEGIGSRPSPSAFMLCSTCAGPCCHT